MSIIQVPVPKAGKEAFLSVDTDSDIPSTDIYAYLLMLGLKTVLNRGQSKVTKTDIPDDAKRQAEAMRIAGIQLEALREGKVRGAGSATKKASGEVMTEARRIAKAMVKDGLRAAGQKPSHIAPKVISDLAKQLIDADPSILAKAKAVVEERKAAPVSDDVKALFANVKADPKLVAKAEADKAKRKQLSATQAGKTQTRAKGAQASA